MASASTNDATTSMEPQHEVRVYRDCVRGVRRVAGLKRQQLAAGVDVGVASGAGLSLLLSPRHIEFALVIDARCLPTSSSSSSSASTSSSPSSSSSSSSSNHASGGPQWLGFSYFGYLENLKRCFRKPHDDLLSYFKIIHENLTTQFSDPNASPLLFVGDSYEKAFWQISSPEAPHSVVGFIPFRPVSLFHSFKSHPIIAMEGGNYPIFTMISGIDRHRLRAVSPELEARYQQTVQTATALVSPHKLSHLQVHSVLSSKRAASPVANGNANANGHGNNNKKKTSADGRKYSGEVVRKLADDFYKHYASSKSEDKKSLQPILVSGLVLALGSVTREVELVTLSMASTGKTHLMQAAQILPPLTTGGGGGKALKDNLSDADRLAKELDHYQRRLEQLKLLLAQEPRIAIYNPFLPAASTVLLPTPAPSSSAAAAASSPAHHAHQPPQQQFDMSTQTASAAAAAAPSLLTASLQRPLTSAATSARHHQASTTIEFPSPTPVDNSNSNSAANGNGGRQPSPAPAFRAPSTYLPASSSSSVSTPTSSAVSTSPSISLHSSASGPAGASVSNSGSGSLTPVSSMSHRLATASRPVTPSSFSSSSSSSINPARPFLRLSGSQDYTHAPDMSLLYRRLIELLYVAHPIPGGVGGSFAPSALSSPFAGYAGLRGSSTPPSSLGASSASLPVRRFFAPSAAPANTPLSLSRTSSGFIRRSASPSTITFLQPSTSSSSSASSSSSSWKRFPRATTPISSTIAFPAPAPAVDYADFVTPEQLLAANGNGGSGAQRQGDAELASHSPQALHHHRLHHRPQSQPAPVSSRASESPLQHHQPPQPFSHPPQPYPHPHPLQQRPMGPPVPVPVPMQAAPAVAQPEPLPEHHPHAPAAGAPARVLRLSQSHAPHHPRVPDHHPHHQPQQQPALRASSGGLAPPATAEAVHPNESASDFLLRLIGANKDASQVVEEDQARVAEAPTKGPVVLPLDPSHIDRSILASSVAAALAKHQQQHQHQQHQAQQQGHFGGVHVY